MCAAKYDKYIKRGPLGKTNEQPEIKDILRFDFNSADNNWGSDIVVGYGAIDKPFYALKEPHTHPYDEFVCLMGGDPMNLDEFDAEIDFCFGEEQEKHVITTAAVLYCPANLPHCRPLFAPVRASVVVVADAAFIYVVGLTMN